MRRHQPMIQEEWCEERRLRFVSMYEQEVRSLFPGYTIDHTGTGGLITRGPEDCLQCQESQKSLHDIKMSRNILQDWY